MEIRTAFSVILGIMMVATVIIAMIALMGGLMTVSVEECEPADYSAGGYSGKACGTSTSGQLRCRTGDTCVDYNNARCCEENYLQEIRDGLCCKRVEV
ncbi:MAG: hypothetical protein V1818_03730 [Candidatus Aenigmatarchaeota archaeon]